MKTINKTKFAIGTSLIAGLTGCVNNSESNPFSQQELSSGYMNQTESASEQHGTVKMKDGTCGEGKCGEGKCGDKKTQPMTKSEEGKCGEGKCGGNK